MAAVATDVCVISTHEDLPVGCDSDYPFRKERGCCVGVAAHHDVADTGANESRDEQSIARPQRRLHAGIRHPESLYREQIEQGSGVDC
jgi:hypothetical protein